MRNETVDRSIQKRKEAAVERRRKELADAIAWVMSDPRGRLVMYDLIWTRCCIMDVYQGQDSGIYRHEGKREVGGGYVKQLQFELPMHYVTMINERQRDHEDLIEKQAAPDKSGDEDA